MAIGDTVPDDLPLRIDTKVDPFLDDRLQVSNLPIEAQNVTAKNTVSGEDKDVSIALYRKPGRWLAHAGRSPK